MARPTRQLAVLVSLVFATTLLAPAPAQAAPTWQPVSDLSATGQAAAAPQVAVDDAGNATAIWLRSDGTHDIVQASTRPAGGAWSAPTDLSLPGQDATYPQLAVGPDGGATAIWYRGNANDIVQAASRPVSGAWSAPTDLSTAGEFAARPDIAVDPTGTVTAVWNHFDGLNTLVQAASRPAAGDWSAPVDLSATGGTALAARIAVDPTGNATAVWRRHDGANYIVQAARRPVSGAWSAPVDLSAPGLSAFQPHVVLDDAGLATAVWRRSNGSNDIIQAATRSAGGSWSVPTDVSATGEHALSPNLAIDGNGNATAVWYRSNSTEYVVQTATRSAGGAWSAVTNLSATGGSAGDPQIVVDGAGNATAVWYRTDGTNYAIQTATRPAGGSWPTATDLSATGQDARSPQIATDTAGNATVVWSRSNGTHNIIQARGLDMAGPAVTSISIPTSATAGQPVPFSVTALDTWSSVAAIAWNFGDGGSASGTVASHTYAAAGTYTVDLTITDAVGNTTERTTSLDVTAEPVIPPQVIPPPLTTSIVAPEITGLRLKPKQVEIKGSKRRTRTKVVLRLTEDAKVTITLKRKGAKGKQARQRIVLRKSLDSGRTKLRLTSKQLKRKLGKKNFKPGRYKLTVKAFNPAGNDRRRVTLRVRR